MPKRFSGKKENPSVLDLFMARLAGKDRGPDDLCAKAFKISVMAFFLALVSVTHVGAADISAIVHALLDANAGATQVHSGAPPVSAIDLADHGAAERARSQ